MLDDELSGVISGWDYSQTLYAAPILLAKREYTQEEAAAALGRKPPRFLGVEEPATDDAPPRPRGAPHIRLADE